MCLHNGSIMSPTVPVGGPITVQYDYDVGENYGVIQVSFHCKAANGSLPRYQWYCNETLLRGPGSFYRVVNQDPGQSMLKVAVGQSSNGVYHCEVSDSFDNTNTLRSKRHYLDADGTVDRLLLL